MRNFFLATTTLFLLSILVNLLLLKTGKPIQSYQTTKVTPEATQQIKLGPNLDESDHLKQLAIFTLKERDINESVKVNSYTVEPFQGNTDVYVRSSEVPQFSISGFFRHSYTVDLENDGNEEFVIEVETGHSIDTSVYKYSNRKLNRILISEGSAIWESITARNTPEFKDINNDGILEMFAYYRFFPPEKRRKVELYKFNGQEFLKVNEYEESTTDFYL